MRKQEVEALVYRTVQRVQRKEPREDSFVELKASWLSDGDHHKTAARLGGLANAAHGELILWLIGIDEVNGVCGADEHELANWFPQIISMFDGRVAPDLQLNVNVDVEEKTVVALLFATDRAPYVLKTKQGGSPEFYVPYRQGNRTQAARRSDLLEILLPATQSPSIEILKAKVNAREEVVGYITSPTDTNIPEDAAIIGFYIEVDIYFEAQVGKVTTIPFHRSTLELQLGNQGTKWTADLTISPPLHNGYHGVGFVPEGTVMAKPESLSPFIVGTPSDLIVSGLGVAFLRSGFQTRIAPQMLDHSQELHVVFGLHILGSPHLIRGDVVLQQRHAIDSWEWQYKSH